MTSQLYRQSRGGCEYIVEFERNLQEFRVCKMIWSIYNLQWEPRGIGSSIRKDKSYEEYSSYDYEAMILAAIEEEAHA